VKKREKAFYELSSEEFKFIAQAIYKIRIYHDANGSESPDLLEEAVTDLEVIFDDVERC
jgi:hypothetical protein